MAWMGSLPPYVPATPPRPPNCVPHLLPLAPPNQALMEQQENIDEPDLPEDLIDEILNDLDDDVAEATICFEEGYTTAMYGIEEEDKEINLDYLLL